MSTTLYKEAIAEAQQLKQLAEQNAKNKIIEALTPRIQAMVESQLLSEDSEVEIEEIETAAPATTMAAAAEAAEELVGDKDDDSEDAGIEAEVEANVVINAKGDVNLTMAKENLKRNLADIKEAINMKQIRSRNMIVKVKNKNITELEVSGNPIKISGFVDANHRNKAPEPNANRNSILKEFNIEDI